MLSGWWKHRTIDYNVLGIDINSDTVKLVEVDSSGSKIRLEIIACAPLPAGAMIKNEIKDPAAIGAVLKDLLSQSNITNKHAAIAVPRSSVTIKTTPIDSRLSTAEIETRAWVEANRQFPELIGGVYLDYQILGNTANDPNQLDLMLVACRKEHIDPYLEVLKQSNLIADLVDVNSFALQRVLPLIKFDEPKPDTVALLNLDYTVSSLIVVHKDELIYANDHSYDGHRLMTKAQEYLNNKNRTNTDVQTKSAETVVDSVDAPSTAPVIVNNPEQTPIEDPAYLEILRENLIAQLRHAMHFFYSSRPNINIQKMVLTGDCVSLPRIAQFVQQEMGIETIAANPFLQMDVSNQVNQNELNVIGPTLMLACGLSINSEDHVNLLPWREQARKMKKNKLMITIASFMAIAVVIAFLIHFYLGSLVAHQIDRNNYLQAEIGTQQNALTVLQKKKQDEIALKTKLHFLMSLQTKSNNSVKMLDELTRIIPGTIALTGLADNSESIVIEGIAQSDLDITSFMQKISQSPIFSTPILTEISTKNVSREGEKSFQLKVQHANR